MSKFFPHTVFLGLFSHLASAQSVLIATTAPENNIVDSSPIGVIDTALFDEDANANHSRGQLFTLPDEDQIELSAITLRKSTAQSYANDTLTMRIFQGTQDQWDSGTGHETAVDGDDYLVDTTVTLLHTETFTLNSAINNNDFVTFEFASPIVINGGTDFGFFMTYDQVNGTENRFRHRENGTGGGRLSITSSNHGTTADTSRRIHYYIQGTIIDSGIQNPTITTSATLIEAGGSVDVNVTFDRNADTATLSTSSGLVDLFAVDATDDVPGNGMVLVTDNPTSTISYDVLLTKEGEEDERVSAEVLVVDPSTEAPDNLFSSAIKVDAPLFYYRFEERADSNFLFDSSGNGHHSTEFSDSLTLGGGTGGMQNAAQFANSSILVPATSNMGASFTATAVVNSNVFEAGVLQGIFSMLDANFVGRSIVYTTTNERFGTFIDGVANLSSTEVTPSNDTSCLIHFVFNADPDDDPATTDSAVSFYLNGELAGGATLPLANAVAENNGQWVIGSHKNRTSQYFQGFIDEAAIFESALSGEQITAHATAFFAAADPLLGFVSDITMIDFDDPLSPTSVNFSWKISDTATAVTINGIAQVIDGGGIYTSTFNPKSDQTYTIEVTGPNGPFTQSIDITVVGVPPGPPSIASISADRASPPNITLVILGTPNTTYIVKASADLNDDFPTEMVDEVATDESGVATVTFPTLTAFPFFRVEEIP
ncbi:MAG: LamG-like jellyroll fold domain-containing protein [Akkermansiaceae bacterium]